MQTSPAHTMATGPDSSARRSQAPTPFHAADAVTSSEETAAGSRDIGAIGLTWSRQPFWFGYLKREVYCPSAANMMGRHSQADSTGHAEIVGIVHNEDRTFVLMSSLSAWIDL